MRSKHFNVSLTVLIYHLYIIYIMWRNYSYVYVCVSLLFRTNYVTVLYIYHSIWNGVFATFWSGIYTLSFPRERCVLSHVNKIVLLLGFAKQDNSPNPDIYGILRRRPACAGGQSFTCMSDADPVWRLYFAWSMYSREQRSRSNPIPITWSSVWPYNFVRFEIIMLQTRPGARGMCP